MTKTEFEWVREAVDKLDKGEVSKMQEAKILRAIAQIFGKAADVAEQRFIDRVDEVMAHNAFLNKISQ